MYRLFMIVFVVGLIAPRQVAAQTVYEPFDYSAASPVLGQNGGIGWGGPWTFTGNWTTSSPGLTFGSLVTQGNAAQGSGAAGSEVRRNFASSFLDTGGDVWFSFLTQPNADPTNSANGLILVPGAGSTGGRAMWVGWLGVGGETTYGMATFSNIGFVGTSLAPTVGQTAFLVGRIQFAAGNDTITLWANPTPGLANPDTAGVVKTDYDFGTSIDSAFLVRSFGDWTNDEIRFGDSFASVSAIPEPTTWALIATVAVSGSGLVWRRRLRNRKRTYARKA
ncbi:MAG TPA: PEP-CTERM sorting domain-containing protein [Gemmatales bacterium]|nr:PEP-CTERM sorting domain-containing protein [Gemmatales bacterium]